jgi:hypothetical protein
MQSICPIAFCEIAVGTIFTLSSCSKLRDFPHYVKTIHSFHLLPKRIIPSVAAFLLILELSIVLLLISWKLAAFYLASILLIVFSLTLATVLYRKIQAPCNCFGRSPHLVSQFDLVRNTGFLACSIGGICLSTNPTMSSLANPFSFVVTSIAAVLFVWISTQLSEIYQLFQAND